MIWDKNLKFLLCIFEKIGLEIVFGDILFLGKILNFFSFFLLNKINLEKCFVIVWIRSKPLQTLKILILHTHQTGFFLSC